MVFKNDWEKTDQQVKIAPKIIEQMIAQAYPDNKLTSQKLISGGCANLNYKIELHGVSKPVILRIYIRDKDASTREQNLGALLKDKVPAPQTIFIHDYQNYRFAITQFVPGITLRELLLGKEDFDLKSIMRDAGQMLAKISQHTFTAAGFFDPDLKVKSHADGALMGYALEILKRPSLQEQLDSFQIEKIKLLLESINSIFAKESPTCLVHGDFDPANILVDRINGQWQITGILDWEFAFSGSSLWDVANMLRYAHQMPEEFKEAFIEGLTQSGFALREDYLRVIQVLNLSALLDLLSRTDGVVQPVKCHDILNLIDHIIQK